LNLAVLRLVPGHVGVQVTDQLEHQHCRNLDAADDASEVHGLFAYRLGEKIDRELVARVSDPLGVCTDAGNEVVRDFDLEVCRETIHFPRPKPPAGISLPKSVKLPMPPPLRVDTWLDALTSKHGDAISFQSARIVLSRSGCTQS
jgi:hypothetical protein